MTPPPPPPDVDATVAPPDPNVTTRQRLEEHRVNPACASCHALFDPYGLAFEHYDGIGRYRTEDGVQAVDATATLPEFGDVQNAVDLLNRMAESDSVRSCMTKSWFRYALGRLEADQDAATLDKLMQDFATSQYRIADLLVSIATADTFRFRSPVVP